MGIGLQEAGFAPQWPRTCPACYKPQGRHAGRHRGRRADRPGAGRGSELAFGLLRRFHPLVSTRVAAAAHPVAAVTLVSFGGPAAYAFALLHGAGNGILTIAKGTLPLALFGAAGYGRRIGWLNAPARVLQAAAPRIFSAAPTAWGLSAIWLTAGIGVASFIALLALRRT